MVLAYKPAPSLGPLVRRLQTIVDQLGDEAILVDLVQDLAVLACLGREQSRLEFFSPLLDRLRAAAGAEWPLLVPLDERTVEGKDALAFVADLDSIEAEWRALDRMIKRGWNPRESTRTRATPDWLVERDGILPVEVKFKKDPSYVPMYWASMMTGIGMLPTASFLSDFKWGWDIPPTARDRDVFTLARSFLRTLPDAERVLRSGLELFAEPTLLLRGECYDFTAECGFNEFRQWPAGIDFDLKINDLVLTLSARPFPLTQVGAWESGAIFATYERSYDETVAADLKAIFTRLNITKQVLRNPNTLVVLRWQVSPELMRGINLGWLQAFWDELTAAEGWPTAVLWPVGVPGGDSRWIENDGAKRVLMDSLAMPPPAPGSPAARIATPEEPGRHAVSFVTDLWDADRVGEIAIEIRDLSRRRGTMIDNLQWGCRPVRDQPDKRFVVLSGDGPISRELLFDAARASGVEIEDVQVSG